MLIELQLRVKIMLHQGNLAERIIHYNLHGGVDNGISGIIIPCQPPRGDYNGLSFLLNFPDVVVYSIFSLGSDNITSPSLTTSRTTY